jgi:hypothetical protein
MFKGAQAASFFRFEKQSKVVKIDMLTFGGADDRINEISHKGCEEK